MGETAWPIDRGIVLGMGTHDRSVLLQMRSGHYLGGTDTQLSEWRLSLVCQMFLWLETHRDTGAGCETSEVISRNLS